MKYRRLLVVPMVALLFLLSACSGAGGVKKNPGDEATYLSVDVYWPMYKTAQELVERGSFVLIGTVTDISYQVLDMKTAEPPTEESEEGLCELYTLYDIKVIKTYKGDVRETIRARKIGGDMGVRVEEQRKALGEDAVKGIPIVDGWPDIEVGKTYLFVLYRYKADVPSILNPYQGVHELTETGAATTTGLPTLKDIVTYFGAEQWDELQKLLPEARK